MSIDGQDFHITIGTSPSVGADLTEDLRLVKAAILYGDKAKLCSMASSCVLSMKRFGQMSADQQFDLIVSIVPFLMKDEDELKHSMGLIELYKQTVGKKHKGAREYQLQAEMKRAIKKLWEDSIEKNTKLMQPEATRGLEKAISEGLLEVHFFDRFKDTSETVRNLVNDSLANDENIHAMMYEYLGMIAGAVQNGETYPMFDDATGGMLKAVVNAGGMMTSSASIAQGKQSALAADLLKRLPVFNEATVHEVIDIRRELARPLIRFRGAIIGYADKIKSASWDKDFTVEAEQVFRRDLEPTVLEIEDAVNSNQSLLALCTRKIGDKNVVLNSLFSFVVSNFTDLPKITGLMLAAGVGSASLAIEVWNEWVKQKTSVEKNQLYFYYSAKNLLSEGDFAYKTEA